MIITTDLDFFQVVFLRHDYEQLERQVVEAKILPGEQIMYCLQVGSGNSWHYREEILTEKDETKIIE